MHRYGSEVIQAAAVDIDTGEVMDFNSHSPESQIAKRFYLTITSSDGTEYVFENGLCSLAGRARARVKYATPLSSERSDAFVEGIYDV